MTELKDGAFIHGCAKSSFPVPPPYKGMYEERVTYQNCGTGIAQPNGSLVSATILGTFSRRLVREGPEAHAFILLACLLACLPVILGWHLNSDFYFLVCLPYSLCHPELQPVLQPGSENLIQVTATLNSF